jgi:peptidyl-prolyl cis-trans isomerase C
VVLNDKPERDAQALALAERLAEAVRGAHSGEELIRLARAVPANGFQIRAEDLPFLSADGRDFARQGSGFKAGRGGFNTDFARAANALQNPGDQSPPVKTSFGYHVIRLEERAPALSVPPAELSERLAADALVRRAGRARRELLDKLRQASPVQVERAANELTAQVKAP